MGSISTRIDTDYSYLFKKKAIKEYSIVFKNGEEILKTVKGPEGTPVSCPDVEKEGYDFNGWSVNGKTPILPVDAITDCDITYVALWFEKTEVFEVPTVQLADVSPVEPVESESFSTATIEFDGPFQADGTPAEPLRAKQESEDVEAEDNSVVIEPEFDATPADKSKEEKKEKGKPGRKKKN